MKMIRTAIIGYGLAGKVFHGPLIAATPSMEVTAVVTSNAGRQVAAKTDFPGATIYDSDEVIYECSEEFDLVVLATPNGVHAQQAINAMNAGLAVVVDKPFATNSADCQKMIDLQKTTGVMLTVFHNRRWDNDFLTIEKIIKEKTLHPVCRFESRFERYRPVVDPKKWRESSIESGGGLLFDLQSHLIDQACHLFGTPKTVYAEVRNRRPDASADDDTFVALSFGSGGDKEGAGTPGVDAAGANGASIDAHLWTNVVSAIRAPRFRILAVNGSFEKYALDPQEDALRAGSRPGSPGWGVEDEKFSGELAVVKPDNSFVVSSTVPSVPGCYEQFYSKVAESIKNGTPPPVDPADALRTIKIIEAAKRSSQKKEIVKFE